MFQVLLIPLDFPYRNPQTAPNLGSLQVPFINNAIDGPRIREGLGRKGVGQVPDHDLNRGPVHRGLETSLTFLRILSNFTHVLE
jgi:hypothetical protein